MSIDALLKNKETGVFRMLGEEYAGSPKKKERNIFVEKLILFGKWVHNHSYYTVCMDSHEEAVGIFRVCSNRIKGILCYDELKIDKLKRIEIKGREYLICPKAVKFWDENDFQKYKIS